MRFYSVPEDFLFTLKELVNEYSGHDKNCSYQHTDFCDCGYTRLIRRSRSLEQYIKEDTTRV
jgi:hypothetical protein